ncbi:signalosome complex subunit 1 [Seminavis robusta]|uniref:Signalosome complex subunit 1 n=1 Tax=Seminavis robusta TaxID=568900 RepID=A0A9N8HMF9_9STRA|nr:signalosome complex subunit 1 [Seminavis robusta]|eukprot:Sro895_g217250.1 signalosome complex subunit 1 (493) ;mRNA; r:37338-38903
MMDLEAYIQKYKGETRLQRLLHIGKVAQDASLVTQAYELAETQMKEDGNVLRYKEVFGDENGPSPSHPRARSGNVVYDHDFLVETDARNRGTRDMLTGRLHTAQAHLNKEAIRTAYLALAEADVLRGDLTEAYHAALRAKDYCTNRQQTSQVSFLVLELAIHLHNYNQVRDFTFKVQHTLLPGGSSSSDAHNTTATTTNNIADRLLVASALERLAHGDFPKAAAKFRQVCATSGAGWDTLIAPEDIATYAAVTSMASASRKVLQEWIEHPEALEFLAPPLQEALFQLASRANYAAAWKHLQEFTPNLQLDLFLAPHLDKILPKIREACILEYWIPYQRVSLAKMAQDLEFAAANDSNNSSLVSVIERLMRQGALRDCRMDCRTQSLIRDTPSCNKTRRKLQNMGQQVLDDTYAMVIRLACVESDLVVMDPQQQNSKGRRGNRGDGYGDEDDDIDDAMDSDDDTPMVDVGGGPAIIGDDEPPEMGAQNPEDLY